MYFKQLEQAGWSPSLLGAEGGLKAKLSVVQAASRVDVVVLLRKSFFRPIASMLRRSAKVLILDMDDAIFVSSTGQSSGTRLRRFAHMARCCDAVWAGNRHLADVASRYNTHVTVLPTSVPVDWYREDFTKPSDTIDLVWIGSTSTRRYLQEVLPALGLVYQRTRLNGLGTIRLKIIADFDLPESPIPTLAVPWTAAGEASALGSAHIGIAPMPDDPWTRGKCGLKILQYMACGLPVIASNTGVHPDLVRDGCDGLLVRSREEWVNAIVQLASDPSARQSMGRQGRQRVIEQFSVGSTFGAMNRCLENLVQDEVVRGSQPGP